MADATGTSAQVRLVGLMPAEAPVLAGAEAEFAASGRVISFPGFLRAYVEGEDDPEAELADREVVLPALSEGESLAGVGFEPGSHATQPPARYTEASLVKAMEELGVGRPSTYASVIATILDRGYVWKKGTALVPSFTAFAVVGLLERYFADLVDYGFTASMENDLDEIAEGREEALPWLTRFYFGSNADGASAPGGTGGPVVNGRGASGGGDTGRLGLKSAVAIHLGEIDAREINSIGIGDDDQGRPIVARVGRYGPYLQRGDDRASIPEDMAPDELTIERAEELLAAPSHDRVLGADPDTGLEVQVRAGRFGPYVQLGDVVDGAPKPRTSSLFSSMTPATLTLEEALQLLRIPRLVGQDPESGEEVTAHNGKFGPYLKRGKDTRSLNTEDQLLTVTLEEAAAIFAQPKARRGRATAGPLRELGNDSDTGLAVVLREGRFGPYVTDGTTNASLRKGDDIESVTIERASELLGERRAAGPSSRGRAGGAKKTATKKTAAKKTAAKKTTAKKSAAKKSAAKKTTATTTAAPETTATGEAPATGPGVDGDRTPTGA
jgi:DNA topoisomerase-1